MGFTGKRLKQAYEGLDRTESVEVAEDPLVGHIFDDRYEVLSKVASGGFGTVYRVRNLELDTIEALKVLHPHVASRPKQIRRFRQDAQLLRELAGHTDFVPKLHHFDQDGRYQYKAFGVPLLGLKWDQGERLVISSYASMLGLPYVSDDVVRNSRRIETLGGWGSFGFYEALDFGTARDNGALACDWVYPNHCSQTRGKRRCDLVCSRKDISRYHQLAIGLDRDG